MALTTEHRLILTGLRSGDGPATWGQRTIWRRIHNVGSAYAHTFNLGRRVSVPAGLRTAAVLDALGQVVGRYDALRTRYVGDEPAELRQHLPSSDALMVGVCEAGDQHVAVLPEVSEQFIGIRFDPARDMGIRALIITQYGVPRTVLLGLSHAAVDRTSARILGKDLTALLVARAHSCTAPDPAAARQPLEQASYESSAGGARASAKALRHWRHHLKTAPVAAFPSTHSPTGVQFCSGELRSVALAMATDVLAVRYRTSTSTVLLAASAIAAARESGIPAYPVRLAAGNRWVAGLRHAVGSLTQSVPTTIDLTGPSFADVVRQTWSSMIFAYANGQYDPTRLGELEHALNPDRSTDPGRHCYFNDLRTNTRADWARAAAATADAVHAARATTTFRWVRLPQRHPFSGNGVQSLLHVARHGDALGLSMLADASLIPPERVRSILHDIERLLVVQAAGPL